MIPDPAHVDAIDAHPIDEADEPAVYHHYRFEAWPPDNGRTYPIQLPGRTPVYMAPNGRAARQAAITELAITHPGWMVGAGSHVRSRCVPPHPGQRP